MDLRIHTLVFDSLAFMRENGKVFRKYIFLPLVFSISSLFVAKIPVIGLAGSSVINSLALALLGVSVTRFYLYRNPDVVAEGANRPFARFFFLTFVMTCLGHASEIFNLLPEHMRGGAMMWMLFGIWVNIKICLAFPALAADHPGSLWENVKSSFEWTSGYALKIVGSFLLCYSPIIFFTMMMMQAPDLMPDDEDFWGSLPQLIFSDILIIFSMMWSSLVLAKLYQGIVLGKKSST